MPKYQFPLSDQDDYRGRILFTTIIETPASIDQAALDRVSNAASEGVTDTLKALKDFGTKEIQSGYATPGESVALYLPPAQQVQDAVQFDNMEFGIRGAMGLDTIQNGGQSLVGTIGENLFGTGSISKLLENIGSQSVARVVAAETARRVNERAGGVISTATQTVANPNIRAVFKSVRPREHTFTFKFLPRNEREAKEIENIIKFFRKEVYPESINIGKVSVGYKFPNKFAIQTLYNGKKVGADLLPSYLTSMSTNYNSTSMSFYRDGQYSEIDLTLTMLEFRTLSKQDVELGFNFYGDGYANWWETFVGDVFPNWGP
jgi:hypothetical protein